MRFPVVNEKYRYEHGDLVALLTLLNTLAIILWNKGAYIGLPVALAGIVYDLRQGCHWNNLLTRLSLVAMNVYFLIG